MTELEHFQRLKQQVLLKYQEHYPFFKGSWKTFSAQDIQNLIGLIEEKNKHTISEKWIYTHLKPETNQKIPRKDMLNILAQFVGISGWDEFVFETVPETAPGSALQKKPAKIWWAVLLICTGIAVWYFGFHSSAAPKENSIQLNNEFTNEKIQSDEVKVVQLEDSVEKPLEVKDGKVQVSPSGKKETKLLVKSPFYHPKTIIVNNEEPEPPKQVALTPDDYAMMLKAFMVSDVKDWQTRKVQLNKILADDLEVIVMLKGNIGAEYFDKNEFSQKLIVPTAAIRKMKIIELENNEDNKIRFIRIKQE
ncbi:MAG: hypothetical protein QM710_13230 [Flavobacterium sp.]